MLAGAGLVLLAAPAHAFTWQSVLQFLRTMQSETSAWAVTTKQTAVAADQVATMDINAKKQLATAVGSIGLSDRLMKARVAFDPVLGQPVTVKCVAQTNNKLFVEATSQAEKDAGRLMSTFASTRVSTKAAAEAELLATHRRTYCTASEAKQGLCKLSPNGMQGWDVNYGGAYAEKTLSPEGEAAAYAYAAMVGDERAEIGSDCATTSCAAAQARQLAQASVGAMAASALVGQVVDRRMPMLTGK
jgi:hypothetical protein